METKQSETFILEFPSHVWKQVVTGILFVEKYDTCLQIIGQRRMFVTITYAHYTQPSTYIVEFEGSPPKYTIVYQNPNYADVDIFYKGRRVPLSSSKTYKTLISVLDTLKENFG